MEAMNIEAFCGKSLDELRWENLRRIRNAAKRRRQAERDAILAMRALRDRQNVVSFETYQAGDLLAYKDGYGVSLPFVSILGEKAA